MTDRWAQSARRARRDAGVTLVEVLVAMTVFGVLGTLLLGLGLATSRANDDVRSVSNVGEEARLGMERIARELRQTSAVSAVSLPQHAGDPTSFTVWIDLDGNHCIATSGPDPVKVEQITYRWDPGTSQLTMTASGFDSPLLATRVTAFGLDLDSSSWQYDTGPNGVPDGVTTWQEIDDSSIGDHNPTHFSSAELSNIDLIGLRVTTTDHGHAVNYTTRVDLRNQHANEVPTPC